MNPNYIWAQTTKCIFSKIEGAKKFIGAKPLPRKLFFQIDNCVKDNKNHHLLIFLFLLTPRKMFEEVQLGFLIEGHTHEDIDGNFRYIFKKLE